jgi:hypothetical protein
MGKCPRYTDEFNQGAVSQVVIHGQTDLEVIKRLGITNKSLGDGIEVFGKLPKQREEESYARTAITRLKRELKRAE